jgi:hypothetical protein
MWVVWGYQDFAALPSTTLDTDKTVGGIDFKRISSTWDLINGVGLDPTVGGTVGLDLNTLPNRDAAAEATLAAYGEVVMICEMIDGFGTYNMKIGNWSGGVTDGDNATFVRNTTAIFPQVWRSAGQGGDSNASGAGVAAGSPWTDAKHWAVKLEGHGSRVYWDTAPPGTYSLPVSLDSIANVGTCASLPFKNLGVTGAPGKALNFFDGSALDQARWFSDSNRNITVKSVTVLAR